MAYKILLALAALLITESQLASASSPITVSTSPKKPSDESRLCPSDACQGIRGGLWLNFSSVGLQRVHSDFLSSPNVSCLSLESNELVHVSANAFRHAPNLHYLNLARNGLALANLSDLAGHSHLCTLILDSQSEPGSESFELRSSFPSLQRLYLRNNSLKELSSLAFAPRLTQLYLSSNGLGESELAFLDDPPEFLELLDLSSNSIRSLNTSKLTSLRQLRLDDNKIGAICSGSSCDESALVLEAAGRLESLSLPRNRVRSLESNAFEHAQKLRQLDLSDNRIDKIDEGTFLSVGSLSNLSLRGNELSEMPDLCGPESLQFLTLANNRLEVIGNDSFCRMSQLAIIDLSGNKIKTIDNEAFGRQASLTELRLSNNMLKSLPSMWLYYLSSLRVLHLDGNRFEALNNLGLSSVKQMSNLKRIYLQNNSIAKLYTSSVYTAFRSSPNITLELFDVGQSANLVRRDSDAETCKCDCDSDNEITDFFT